MKRKRYGSASAKCNAAGEAEEWLRAMHDKETSTIKMIVGSLVRWFQHGSAYGHEGEDDSLLLGNKVCGSVRVVVDE